MAKIRSYTTIEQSRKLAEILPLESADYFHAPDAGIVVTEPYKLNEDDETVITAYKGAIPCWSLTALLDVLPEGVIENYYVPNLQKENGKYSIAYGNDELLCIADNPVDACYEMILKLHELNLL